MVDYDRYPDYDEISRMLDEQLGGGVVSSRATGGLRRLRPGTHYIDTRRPGTNFHVPIDMLSKQSRRSDK